MEQNDRKTGMINWVSLLAVTALSLPLARYADTGAGFVAVAFFGLGFLVAAVSQFQMRLEDRERLEQMEVNELRKARGESTLFTGDDTFPAKRSREQFERFLVPAFTVALLALQGLGAWWFWQRSAGLVPPSREHASLGLAFYAFIGSGLFLLGQISANLARLAGSRLLRPGAGYLMLGSFAGFIVAGVEAATWAGFGKADFYVARGFAVALGLVAIETLVALVLEIYRPRVQGQRARVLYESRLVGLLGQPGGLITTAAQALDYQFGFKVSETWFYRFLERAASWIILLQLGLLALSTTFVIIDPDEQALLERFGRRVEGREVLGPGFHLKWPWPIDQVYRYSTRHIQSFIVGVIPDPELERERTVLWTRPHYKEEFNLLVASAEEQPRDPQSTGKKAVPANFLAASIPVHYEITNLVQWVYGHADAGRILEDLANREVIRQMVSADFNSIMSTAREATGEQLRSRLQERANEQGLGVRIVYIGLANIHPPIGTKEMRVAAAFEEVVSARQQRETNILGALTYETEKVPAAEAEATNLLTQAESARLLKVETARADADRFQHQDRAWHASPAAYQQRVYLDALTRSLGPVKKYVLAATNTSDVLIVNLEDKVREDLAANVILPPDAVKPPTETKK